MFFIQKTYCNPFFIFALHHEWYSERMETKTIKHDIDYNCRFPITLRYNPAERTLAVSIDPEGNMYRRLRGNLNHLMQCSPTISGRTPIKERIEGDTVYFREVPDDFRLSFANKPFALYQNHSYNGLGVSELRPFTVSALRTLGSQHQSKATPYFLPESFNAFEPLRKKAKATINTDFHTHSSGQISAAGLIRVAKDHNALYPEHLLNDIGITVDKNVPRITQKRIPFQPLEPQPLPDEIECVPLSALRPEQLEILEDCLSLRTDRQHSYTDAENECYRLRYPFTKNTSLAKDLIKEMARESMATGIMHVEISFVGLDKPDTFRAIHEAIWEMEHDPEFKGFTLRLKHGIPRTLTPDQMRESLDKAKILAKSPYVVGVDFLGYEINKTHSFVEELDEFAEWVKDNNPDFTICVHAGENDKNPANVKEAIRIAAKHGVRMRIGHGLYGLDDEAIAMANPLTTGKRPLLHIEANPDSNIALNNINNLEHMPFRRLIDNDMPFVVSSDSLGLYQTSSEQLGLSLLHAGLSGRDLDIISHHQGTLVSMQQEYVAHKKATIPHWDTRVGRDHFLDALQLEMNTVPKAMVPKHERISDADIETLLRGPRVIPESREIRKALSEPRSVLREQLNTPEVRQLREMLRTKIPITLVGASGSSWQRIDKHERGEIAIALDMLATILDPDKVYFVQGRNKREGLCRQLNTTIKRVNAASEKPFSTIGLLTDPTPDSTIDYSHLDYVVRINNPLNVADEIVDFTVRNQGALIAIGGAAFTRDIILKSDRLMDERGKGTLLAMDGPEGASSEKALVMDPSYSFKSGIDVVLRLQECMKDTPDIFKPYMDRLSRQDLEVIYEKSAERLGLHTHRPLPASNIRTPAHASQLQLFAPHKTF